MDGVCKMKFELGKSFDVKNVLNFDKFKKDLDDSLQRSTKQFANVVITPLVRKDTGTLLESMEVLKTNLFEMVIYFDDNKCSYALEAHELPEWYKVTTPGTQSKFLEVPILTRGQEIFETIAQVMKVKGWK